MRVQTLIVFLGLGVVGFARGQNKGAETQRIGDLFIELTGTSTPRELLDGQGRFASSPDHYWVVAEVNFRNGGNRAICANFSGSLNAEYGLVARTSMGNPLPISELLPGEDAQRRFIFTLKRGANPLELKVETVSYGGQCGDSLPRSAALSVQFPIRGVSSPPKEDKPSNSAPLNPGGGGDVGGGVFRIGGGVSQPAVISRVDPEYTEERKRQNIAAQ